MVGLASLFNFSTKANVESGPCWTAAVGTSTTFRLVSINSRELTNSLGKSKLSSFWKTAFNLTVPVVTSTWLSMARSLPVASLAVKSRFNASTTMSSPELNFCCTRKMSSCGTGKMTAIG